MKYLKRINEDVENTIDKEYIDNCFIEFADQSRYESKISEDGDKVWISIEIPSKYAIVSDDGSMPDIFSKLKWKLNEYEEIENCLQKVKIKQPFLFYSVEEENHSNQYEDDDDDGEYADYARININLMVGSRLNNNTKYHHKI
jgi:hypothetical protein